MLKLIVCMITIMVLATSAKGDDSIIRLHSEGFWTTLFVKANSDEEPMCVMVSENRSSGKLVMIKYFPLSDNYELQLAKNSWSIPIGLETTIDFEINNMGKWSIPGGATIGGDNIITFVFRDIFQDRYKDAFALFLSEIAAGSRWRIKFEGNEADWLVELRGSRANASSFMNCVVSTREYVVESQKPTPAPTQPFSEKTQPFNRQNEPDIQPFQTSPNPSVRFF